MGNSHIYEEHIDPIKNILERKPFGFPTIEIMNLKEDINSYELSDFNVSNYECHDVIKMAMIA
jgi:thymidylate synthase